MMTMSLCITYKFYAMQTPCAGLSFDRAVLRLQAGMDTRACVGTIGCTYSAEIQTRAYRMSCLYLTYVSIRIRALLPRFTPVSSSLAHFKHAHARTVLTHAHSRTQTNQINMIINYTYLLSSLLTSALHCYSDANMDEIESGRRAQCASASQRHRSWLKNVFARVCVCVPMQCMLMWACVRMFLYGLEVKVRVCAFVVHMCARVDVSVCPVLLRCVRVYQFYHVDEANVLAAYFLF